MRIRFREPEDIGLWTVWEDRMAEKECEVIEEVTRAMIDAVKGEDGLAGLGIGGVEAWDESSCASRFSSPSPSPRSSSFTSLSSITDSLPCSVQGDMPDEEDVSTDPRADLLEQDLERLASSPSACGLELSEAEIDEDDTWEFEFALEGPRTPLKRDFTIK
jgi:hypothetical protein